MLAILLAECGVSRRTGVKSVLMDGSAPDHGSQGLKVEAQASFFLFF